MSTPTNRKTKKELAFLLYCKTELSPLAIAEKAGVNYQTVTRWIEREEWELVRAANSITRKQQVRNYLMQLAEINEQIQSREPGRRYPDMKEADVIAKISTTIEKIDKQTSLDDYVSAFEGFLSFLRASQAHDLLQGIEPYMNEFLLMKAAELR